MAYPPQPSAPATIPASPAIIVGAQFCAPYPVDLAIARKVMILADNFTVTDINGNIVFKLKDSHLNLRDRRVLLDAAGNPIMTVRRKVSLCIYVQI